MRIRDIIEEKLIGRKLIDTQFSSKGDREYYDSIGMDYPGFDGFITHVAFTADESYDPMLYIVTTTGVVYVCPSEEIALEDVK